MTQEILRLDIEDGKYTLIHDEKGFRALRYGEEWRDLTGDKLIYCLAAEVEALRAEVEQLKTKELEA